MKRIIYLLLIPYCVYALTMEEAVKRAVDQNLQLHQSKADIKISDIQLKEDRSLFWPEIFANFSFTSMKDTPYTKIPYGVLPFPLSFKQTQKDFRYFDIGINYYLFTGFSRIRKINISQLGIEANRDLFSEKKNQIVGETKKAYLDVLMAKSVVEIYEKQFKAVKKHLERVKEFYKQGLVAKIEVLQTKVRLSQVKRDLKKAKGDLKIAKARLKNLLNENIQQDFDVKPASIKIPQNLDIEKLFETALKNRRILHFFKLKKDQIKNLQKIEISDYYPKVALQVKYFYTDEYPYLDPKENYALSVGLSWKFQGPKAYYSFLKRKEEEKKIKLKLLEMKNQIKLQVKAAYENFQTAKSNLKVAQSSLAEAQEYYRMVVEQFKNQLASTTDVLDAESMLTSARKGKEISYYRLLKAYVELEEAVGGSVDEK